MLELNELIFVSDCELLYLVYFVSLLSNLLCKKAKKKL